MIIMYMLIILLSLLSSVYLIQAWKVILKYMVLKYKIWHGFLLVDNMIITWDYLLFDPYE